MPTSTTTAPSSRPRLVNRLDDAKTCQSRCLSALDGLRKYVSVSRQGIARRETGVAPCARPSCIRIVANATACSCLQARSAARP
eukprot:6124606-Prymnesium_polylepis.1